MQMAKNASKPQAVKSGGFSLGIRSMAKLNAVEGIRLSRETRAMFREFEKNNVPAEERRAAIAKKHGVKA